MCVFCEIIKNKIPSYKVYEDNGFLAFLDINPINPGHVLVVPKKHHDNLHSLPENILAKTGPVLKLLADAVKAGAGAEGVNIGMNNGKAAGQLVNHAHFHVIPRYYGDGHESWRGGKYKDGEAERVLEKIKGEIPLQP